MSFLVVNSGLNSLDLLTFPVQEMTLFKNIHDSTEDPLLVER